MAKQFDILQSLALIETNHWQGMGLAWLGRKAREAINEITKLRSDVLSLQGEVQFLRKQDEQ